MKHGEEPELATQAPVEEEPQAAEEEPIEKMMRLAIFGELPNRCAAQLSFMWDGDRRRSGIFKEMRNNVGSLYPARRRRRRHRLLISLFLPPTCPFVVSYALLTSDYLYGSGISLLILFNCLLSARLHAVDHV